MSYKLYLNGNSWTLNDNQRLTVGRKGHGADIELDDPEVSRTHCQISCVRGSLILQDLSLNGISMNGRLIEKNVDTKLTGNDLFSIGKYEFKVTTNGSQSSGNRTDDQQVKSPKHSFIEHLKQKGSLTIGRDTSNNLVIDDPAVSRRHARLHYENNAYWVEDLGSLNGTYINGSRVSSKTRLSEQDEITISLTSISLKSGVSDASEQKIAISAENIGKVYPNGKVGLNPLSLEIESGTFVALMGPSGCGKSTLLKCLNNDNPATSGQVQIKGLNLSSHFHSIKKKIGYVPQDDIIHKELTVYQTLFYAAKLRLPDDTSNAEIDQKIDKVIDSLKLDQDKKTNIRNVRVKDLSGGQRKRVSIAVELLVEPTILFLDEPTSPLDPESIDSFLRSLQDLTKSGTTIVMVTHKPEDLNYVDKVIFLMVKGYLTYYGKPDAILSRFEASDIIQVYSKMSDKDNEEVNKSKYYLPPTNVRKEKPAPISKGDKDHNILRQLYWLTARYAKIKVTDTNNLALLMAQPIIIAGLISLIFDELQLGVLFLMSISAVWFGVSNAAKEIVGEQTVFRRERMFNLRLNTYIFSKWVVLSAIAAIQSIIFVLILYIKFQFFEVEGHEDIHLQSFGLNIAFMFYLATSATLIGLLLSAYFTNTERVMTVVPIALMPQIMLSGVITKIDNAVLEILSFFTLGRWGTEVFGRIQDEAYGNPKTEQVQSLLIENQTVPGEAGSSFLGSNARSMLNFYDAGNSQLIGDIFDSFQNNLLAISMLNVLIYLLIYYSLHKKHSL